MEWIFFHFALSFAIYPVLIFYYVSRQQVMNSPYKSSIHYYSEMIYCYCGWLIIPLWLLMGIYIFVKLDVFVRSRKSSELAEFYLYLWLAIFLYMVIKACIDGDKKWEEQETSRKKEYWESFPWRNIPYDEAKQEILRLITNSETEVFVEDMVHELKLKPDIIKLATTELIKEGKILH